MRRSKIWNKVLYIMYYRYRLWYIFESYNIFVFDKFGYKPSYRTYKTKNNL